MDQEPVVPSDGNKQVGRVAGDWGCCCDEHDHSFQEYVDFHTAQRSIECVYCGEPGELVNP